MVLESHQTQLLTIFEQGAAKSAQRLTAISGMPWNIHIISVDVGSGERFRSILARDIQEHVGVYFATPGERYLVLFSEESGQALLKASAPLCTERREMLPGMKQATLSEITNIFINGLSSDLADRQGMVRIVSAPTTLRSRKADIYDKAFGDLPPIDQTMVNALIHISSPELAADCTVMLRFDSLSANFLLNPDPDTPPSM